ncbi:MAG TPA: YhjD/YihY/BrkB family envelope integrity protein [Acidimicrobiales bacterium]|nr:YhjD/YihY/BrkB family envelope integrity protein [Acidimicrobiales bacterium]
MKERILGPLRRRWAWFDTGVRTWERFDEVHGNYLAAAVTLTAFLALFPLLLAVIAVVGFFSHNAADLPGEVVQRLGLTGQAADTVTSAIRAAEKSRRAASLVALAGLLWSGLGLVAAFQFAFDSVWQVAGRGLKDKLYGLGWVAGAAVLFMATSAVTPALRILPGPVWPLAMAAGFAVNVAVWLWTFKALTNRQLGWKALLPGAVAGAVGLEVLKVVGGIYVPEAIASSSGLYGSIGVVFAILAWLLLFGRLVVYAAVLNVVRWEEDHGTVRAEIELPQVPGEAPVGVTRAGEAADVPAPG